MKFRTSKTPLLNFFWRKKEFLKSTIVRAELFIWGNIAKQNLEPQKPRSSTFFAIETSKINPRVIQTSLSCSIAYYDFFDYLIFKYISSPFTKGFYAITYLIIFHPFVSLNFFYMIVMISYYISILISF